MRSEVSAGGIIVRKGLQWEVLLIKDMNEQWTFPKGLIELGEPLAKTATREIAEEVGLTNLKLIEELPPIHYYYKRDKKRIYKTVHYFLFQFEGTEKPIPQKEEGISKVTWMLLTKALGIVGYPKTNVNTLNAVIKKLQAL